MKRKNQIYLLLILAVLAIVSFLYFTHKVRIAEGLNPNNTSDDQTGEEIKMSDSNSNSLTSFVEDLETDHDNLEADFNKKIPELKTNIIDSDKEAKSISDRLNAQGRRFARFERQIRSKSLSTSQTSSPTQTSKPNQDKDMTTGSIAPTKK